MEGAGGGGGGQCETVYLFAFVWCVCGCVYVMYVQYPIVEVKVGSVTLFLVARVSGRPDWQ